MLRLLKRCFAFVVYLRANVRAAAAKYFVERQVARVLELTHAQELAQAPRNEWPMIRAKQVEEIRSVKAGQQFDIVDRRSWAYPYLPEALHRLNQPILKNTPYNLRRFSETPIPRRAINLIKNAILSLKWEVAPNADADDLDPERELRIRIATESLKRPNNTDSFREVMEAYIEDILIGGYGTLEPQITPYYKRPIKFWAVDGSTIRIFMDWTESTPDRPRYAQMTGLKGERGIVTFLDEELVYTRDNVRSSTPFGLGKLEVCFNSVNAFLGVQDMSARAGSDQVHKTWLWWEQTLNPAHIQTVRRHLINELEGQAKISLIAGAKKPDIVEVTPVTPEDLLLDWQKFLLDIIAAGFDLSPLALGQTDKVNKATGQVMADSDFRSSVVPTAHRIEEAITRHLLHGILDWKDLEFKFIDLEDPDALTRTMIQNRQYQMNAITPDEIRKKNNMPPLPAGWGKLTFTQTQIMTAAAMAKMTGKAMGSGMGAMSKGMGSGGSGGGGADSGMGGSMGSGSMGFSADDVSQMTPEQIQLFQEFGVLPPTNQLGQQMEQQQPGILNQLTDELQEFFQHAEQIEDEDEVGEAPITPADDRQQLQKFAESEHQEDLAEKAINRRGVFGPPVNQMVRKNPQRGKYPRSAGPEDTGKATDPLSEAAKVSGKLQNKRGGPKGNYRIGRGNRYK